MKKTFMAILFMTCIFLGGCSSKQKYEKEKEDIYTIVITYMYLLGDFNNFATEFLIDNNRLPNNDEMTKSIKDIAQLIEDSAIAVQTFVSKNENNLKKESQETYDNFYNLGVSMRYISDLTDFSAYNNNVKRYFGDFDKYAKEFLSCSDFIKKNIETSLQ